MTTIERPKVVVLGMMSAMPVAGVVWQTLHYLLGFDRLGFDVYYLEAHARTPSMLMRHADDDSTARATEFLGRTMGRFGLGDRWAFEALHADGDCHGMSRAEIRRACRDAELLLNLHGGTRPRPELTATDRLVYVETDPVLLQLELGREEEETIDFLAAHSAFFTFAENWGAPDCLLPVSDRFTFNPTRQPVVVDLWEEAADTAVDSGAYTTVANWRQEWRDVSFNGETYTWSKHHGFLRYADLPSRVDPPLELMLSACTAEERRELEARGWRIESAEAVTADPDAYRGYVARSRGEVTVAKDQNVRLRTGWFSDRSATYLAAGRPAVTEETGFSNVLPSGEGLIAFASTDEAVEAVRAIESDYPHHRRAASRIAREWFSHEVVLGDLLTRVGIRLPARRRPPRPASGIPQGAALDPASRRPLRLRAGTVKATMRRRIPALIGSPPESPAATIVVVTRNNLVLTRLCLESLLGNTVRPEYEVVVVDNGSRDGTSRYLAELASGHARVSVMLNGANAGFPAACNLGLELARGEHLVLLNNDTMVPPGWLSRLLAHLRDPKVGLVGPVTNRIGNEAEVAARYRTWGEFLRFAARRARDHAGEGFEVATVTLFCAAMRRDVFERLGPLDPEYGIGLLEDDDYAMRARKAGYRLRCAEDVVVHHFGEASFGKLVPTGEYIRVLRRNQARFADKWGEQWTPYPRRPNASYASVRDRLRQLVEASVPERSQVLVVSRGDDDLIRFERRDGMHFPQANGGRYAGHHPASSEAALAELEALRNRGAKFLCIPETSVWWLEHYAGLRDHLETQCREIAAKPGVGVIFELNGGAG